MAFYGGYDTPPEIQRAFYEKCGFVATATDEDGVLEWR